MPIRLRRVVIEAALFALVATAYLVYLFAWGDGRFYHDAQRYWQLRKSFEPDGGFSLLSYDDEYRGYGLPLLNYGLDGIASLLGLGDITIVRIWGALLAATLGVVVLPRLGRALFARAETGWARVLVLNALLFVFWRGHFGYPLTDFPALLLVSVGLVALLRRSSAGFIVAGIGFGLAVNLRPMYWPAAVGVVLLAVLLDRPRRSSWLRRGGAGALALIGVAAALAPQVAMNHRNHDTWSPTPVAARSIANLQLTYGLLAQRYETYVGSPSEYPNVQVLYADPVARDILREEHLREIHGYGQYLRIALRHPELLASYALHAFNGLDVPFATPYVRDLRARSWALSILLFTFVFVAAARLVDRRARAGLGDVEWMGVLLLVSPALTVLPTAVEPRYFLPVHALVYVLVCFASGTRESLLAGGAVRRVALVGTYTSFVITCLALSAATRAQIEHPIGAAGERMSSRAHVLSSISSDPARAMTTNPSCRSSRLASGTDLALPIAPV